MRVYVCGRLVVMWILVSVKVMRCGVKCGE